MTRDELIRCMLEKNSHLSYKQMTEIVKELIENLTSGLAAGNRVEIRDFGTFTVRHRAERMARNPKTGIKLIASERCTTHFKPGKELRERVDNAHKDAAVSLKGNIR